MTDFETPAQSLQQIYERSFFLLGLIDRFFLESRWPHAARSEREERLRQHLGLMEEIGRLRARASPGEQELHQRAFGAWSVVDCVNASWRTECLGVLLWAGSRVDLLPEYDEKFNAEPLFEATVGPGWALRSPSELDSALTDAVRWHSRARRIEGFFQEEDEAVGIVLSDRDVEGELRHRTQRSSAVSDAMRAALGERVNAFGTPYETLSFVEFSKARSIARERHYALNWIWDGGAWDDVSMDT